MNKSITIQVGSDHAGYELKDHIIKYLKEQKYSVKDFGTYSVESMDYPDIAHPVSLAVQKETGSLGILICGSGNGVCMTANKHAGIRAALCWLPELGALARQHNNANILCLPSRFIDLETAIEIVNSYLNTEFEGGRHQNRVGKVDC